MHVFNFVYTRLNVIFDKQTTLTIILCDIFSALGTLKRSDVKVFHEHLDSILDSFRFTFNDKFTNNIKIL